MFQHQIPLKCIKAPTSQFPQRQFQIQKPPLCQGAEGTVYKAISQYCDLPFQVALKIHHKNTCVSQNYKNFLSSIKFTPQPSIIKVYDFFDCEEGFVLVMELGKTDLQQHMKQIFDLTGKTCIIQQIIQSIKYLHDRNYIHRDIKPQNFIIASDSTIKLIDFGIIRQDEVEKTIAKGTSQYMAPEVSKGEYSVKADIWSLGCLFYEIYVGKKLFECSNSKELNAKLEKFSNNPLQELNSLNQTFLNQQMKDLIHQMLNQNPEKRPDINEILKRVIVNKYPSNCFLALLKLSENEISQLPKDILIYNSTNSNPFKQPIIEIQQKGNQQFNQLIGITSKINPLQSPNFQQDQKFNFNTIQVDPKGNKHIHTEQTFKKNSNQVLWNQQQVNFPIQNQFNQGFQKNFPQTNNFQKNDNFKAKVFNDVSQNNNFKIDRGRSASQLPYPRQFQKFN